ncbi:peptidase U32-like protein [Nonomuraea polychroma]|uniref:Peptidase U32-like protein n=1 Tax=Nonomuraea polychroma TaxID=46176 RepID=A0A438M8Q8_9ACTN|nr:U32 family peptidase [Nonomuraea polychroma]RVX42005.1 peptidase U32-like protein [Nonomuraea polychroma]
MTRDELAELMAGLGHRLPDPVAASGAAFADGSPYKIEIPSVEGPAVLAAVLEEADRLDVRIHRTSQGSGVFMLTDDEIRQMVKLGAERSIEVNLFLGPRAAWDIGGQAKATHAVGAAARGNEMVAACVNDALRACDLGVRSLLVGDVGVLSVLGRLKAEGRLPADLVLKTSVLMPVTNGPTAAVFASLGASTLNVATDLTVQQLGEIRAATGLPIDLYLEVPDDQGGFVRMYEAAQIVRAAAPVYLKMGVRNAPNIYPVGAHLEATAISLGRERVRRAALAVRLLTELDPGLARA